MKIIIYDDDEKVRATFKAKDYGDLDYGGDHDKLMSDIDKKINELFDEELEHIFEKG